jgi:hypothetical protein
MHTLRKLAFCLLVLPLTLNGLWVLCRDVPPEPQAQSSDPAQPQSPSVDEQKAECERLCARESSLCLVSPGDKTSLTIVVFGVAVFPAEIQVSSPALAREELAELRNLHSDPGIVQPSPPPRA